MSWELIHCRLLNPSESVTKEMFLHQTLTDIPKQFTKKLNQTPYTICYTVNMTTFPEVTTVDTTNLQLGELIHMDLTL